MLISSCVCVCVRLRYGHLAPTFSIFSAFFSEETVAAIVSWMFRTNNVLCRESGTKDETVVSPKPV